MTEQEIFAAAINQTGAQRVAFLDFACGKNGQMRQQVDALLNAHDASDGLLPRQGDRELEVTQVQATQAMAGAILAGRYKLIEAIGEGGMGTVWIAEQTEPVNRKVAIKLVKAGMDSAQVLARFKAERQALALMDHPNIAKVFDGGMTEQGHPYFVMELVKGLPLTEYCDQARLSVKQRLELFVPICQAVQHAHQKGIIHRDLKPSNLLICMYDGKPVPKVIDFGLAKAMLQSHAEQTLHTAIGMMVGTPLYMSPEQAGHNNLDVDTQSDIYSLGVILYELLTGSTPLERQQLKDAAYDEILRLIKEVEPPKPSARLSGSASLSTIAAQRNIDPKHLRKSLTGDLDWIVMKALDKERSRRYETANGLALDIERHLAGKPVLAAPPSPRYLFQKFIRRHKLSVIAVNLVLVAIVAGIAGMTWGLLEAIRRAESERLAKLEAEGKRAEVELQRTRAEQREQEAIDAVRRFGDSVSNNRDLKNNIALESLRKTLLQEPLAFFQSLRTRLESDSSTTPKSLSRLAKAAYDLGKLSDEIGDKDNAILAYEHSCEVFSALEHNHPNVSEYQRFLAASYFNIGRLRYEVGDSAEAIHAIEQSLAIRMRMVRDNPTTLEFASELNKHYGMLGLLYKETGKPTESLKVLEAAIATQERLTRENPDAHEFRSDLAKHYFNFAVLLSEIGRPDEALTTYRRALPLLERLVDENPDATESAADLAKVLHNIADFLFRQSGSSADALELFEKSLAIRDRLARADPTVTMFQEDLASGHLSIGNLLSETGKPANALEAYNHALGIFDRLSHANPSVIDFGRRLAATHSLIGSLYRTIGRPGEALSAERQSMAIRQRLARENPSWTPIQSDLAGSHTAIGVLLHSSGKLDEAMKSHAQATEIQERLARENPERAVFRHNLANSHIHIGVLLREIGRPGESLKAYRQALPILERLARDYPATTAFQAGLAGTQNNIGILLGDCGSPAEALKAYEQALAIRELLACENPTVPAFQSDVGATLNNIAVLDLTSGRVAEARRKLEQAVDYQERALATNTNNPIYRQFLTHHFTHLLKASARLNDLALARKAREGLRSLTLSAPACQLIEERLKAIEKSDPPKDAGELLKLGQHAYDTCRFGLATRLFALALGEGYTLPPNLRSQVAYNAACSAALAASGSSVGEADLDQASKQELRQEALAWLHSLLQSWTKALESAGDEQGSVVFHTLEHWQRDPDLVSIRDPAELAQLPEAERTAIEALWKQVGELLEKAAKSKS